MNRLKLKDDIFLQSIMICKGNVEEIEKWIGDTYDIGIEGTSASDGFHLSLDHDGGDIHFIVIEKDALNTFTHELIHCVMDIFERVGIPISKENDEVFAYYYEYLFKQSYKFIINGKTNKKRRVNGQRYKGSRQGNKPTKTKTVD